MMKPSEYFANKGAKCLYHSTDKHNLDSIRENDGLHSIHELSRREVEVIKPGGNDWSRDADKKSGVHTYVHLCWTDNHPMAYIAEKDGRIDEIKWLKVELSVLDQPGIKYTLEVANKSGCKLHGVKEISKQLDYEVLFTETDWKDPATMNRLKLARKCEILVPKSVRLKYLDI